MTFKYWIIQHRHEKRLCQGIFIAFCAIVLFLYLITKEEQSGREINGMSRRLLSSNVNCSPRAVEQFPHDLFSNKSRTHGALFLHVLGVIYMFLGLAFACDDYFVPALEKISECLHLSEDVAGATLMAAGSSAPELATTLIAVFIAKDDIGLGAVVGSAIFNVMLVPSVCALGAGMVVTLHCWPLVRDCFVYALSIIALTVVIHDEKVTWFEAAALLAMYMMYVILMALNGRISNAVYRCNISGSVSCCARVTETDYVRYSRVNTHDVSSEESEVEILNREESVNGDLPIATAEKVPDAPKVLWRRCCGALWNLICIPLRLVLFLTIPDCRKSGFWAYLHPITFVFSMLWISIFSYFMVWFITVIGFTLKIPDTVMGLTLLAAGSSIPDAITSLIVVRQGQGDMAVANAVGSNIFDILVCLGLPWTLKTLVVSPFSTVPVYSQGLQYSCITLLVTVFLLLLVTWSTGWKLTRRYGFITLAIYFLLTAFCMLYELNVFGSLHLPECNINY